MCDILQQIRAISEREGITITALERSIGASKGVLSRALTNGTDIQSKWVSKIVENYPQYSAEWLITGRGDVLKGSKPPVSPHSQAAAEPEPPEYVSKNRDTCQIDHSKPGATRPRIPFTAAAGALSISADSATESDCERFPVIPNFPDYDFTIKVDGESMCPAFQPDDELACRLVDDAHEVKWGQPYILDTVDGVVLKTLYDGGDNILCKSINKEGPEPYEVSKSDILHIASIVGFTRQLQP